MEVWVRGMLQPSQHHTQLLDEGCSEVLMLIEMAPGTTFEEAGGRELKNPHCQKQPIRAVFTAFGVFEMGSERGYNYTTVVRFVDAFDPYRAEPVRPSLSEIGAWPAPLPWRRGQ